MMTENESSNTAFETLLRVRLFVGLLGEKSRHAWWQTSFYDPTSQAFLIPIFAKTSALAQYHGVLEAARRVHDESLSAGSFHLFRFPEEVEQDMHALVSEQGRAGVVTAVPKQTDDALQQLKALSADVKGARAGPVALGTVSASKPEKLIKDLSGIYASAFSGGVRSFPYFSLRE